MKKRLGIIGATLGAAGLVLWMGMGKESNRIQGISSEKQAYVDRFNRMEAALFGKGEEAEQEGGEMRFDEPEKFFQFDYLKRMDPATGVVPDFALFRAYQNLRIQFPQLASAQRTNYALNWEERGPNNIGGRTRAAMFDPNDPTNKAVFAGGVGGGLWRCNDVTNATPGWVQVSPLFANVAVTCVTYDPSNPQIMYYGTGEGWNNADAIRGAGLWKSTDGGQNWDVLTSTVNSSMFYMQDIVVNSLGHVFLASKGGLWKSTDQGNTWTKVLGIGLGAGSDWICDLEVNSLGDVYAAVRSSGIYKADHTLGATMGDANTWDHFTTNFGSVSRIELAVAQSDPNYLYAVTANNDVVGAVWKSTNGGTTWANTTAQPNNGNDYSNGQAWYDLTLEVDPTDKNKVFTGAIDVYRTTNGGTSWSQITFAYGGGSNYIHPDQHNMVFRPGTAGAMIFTNDGGVWYSSNSGTNVSERNIGYNVTQYYSIAVNPQAGSNILIGGAQDNGSAMVSVPGIGGGMDLTGGDGAYCAINQQKPDTMFTSTQYATIMRSRNGGSSFSYLGNSNLADADVLFINPLEIDPNNGEYLYQASNSLWKHTNAGSGGLGGWTEATVDLGSKITAIGISKSTANLVYVASGSSVYRIPNANAGNWTTNPTSVNTSGLPGGYISCISVNPNDGNHIVVTYTNFGLTRHVMECRNAQLGASATWTNITGNLPDMPVSWAVFEPNNNDGILIGTDLGVFRCADITQASPYWTPERLGMGMPRVDMLKVKYSDNTVHAGTHGRGFWSTNSYNLAPVASFGIVDSSVCGGTVQFVDSTQNASNTWSWDFGDGNTSTNANPQHTYATSGTYTVSLVVSNPHGTDSISQTFQISVLGSPTALAGGDTTVCAGAQVQLWATGGSTYAWWPTAGLDDPTSPNPIYSVTATRTYVVTVTDSNGCQDTDTVTVVQSNAPNTWAGSDQTITQVGDSVQLNGAGGVTYSWSPALGLSCTNCQSPKASPPVTTTYTLTAYNAAGCSQTDQITVFVNIVGMDANLGDEPQFWGAAPNPANNLTVVRWYLPSAATIKLSLMDSYGKLLGTLFEGKQSAGTHAWEANAAPLSAGLYFLSMEIDGKLFTQKLVVSH